MPLDYRPTQSQLTSVADYIDSASLIAQRGANAFKAGGELLNKIYTENQERGAMQDLIKAYDPNNLNSYNEALAQVASKYKGLTPDKLQTLNGVYRTAMNAQLDVDNLSAAKRKMDVYQSLIDQAYKNGDISGTLKANNNAGAYAQENNIRSDAYKYGDVDKLRTSAVEREQRAAMAAAQRAAMRREDQKEVKEDAKFALINAYKDFAVRGNSPEVYAHNMKLFQNLLNQAQAAGSVLNQKDIYDIYGMLKQEQEKLTADPYTPLNANNLQGTLSYSKYKDGERVGTVNIPYDLAGNKASVPLDVNAQMQQLGYETTMAPPPIEPKEEPAKVTTPTSAQRAASAASILDKASSAPATPPPKTETTITDSASIYSPMPAKSTEPLIPKGTNVSDDTSTGSVPASVGIMNKANAVNDVNSFAPTAMWMKNKESYDKYREEQAEKNEEAKKLIEEATVNTAAKATPLNLLWSSTPKAKAKPKTPIQVFQEETAEAEDYIYSDLNVINEAATQGFSVETSKALDESMDNFVQNTNILTGAANKMLSNIYQQPFTNTASASIETVAEAAASYLSGNSLEKTAEQLSLELGLTLGKGGELNAETIASADTKDLVNALVSVHNMNGEELSSAEINRMVAQLNQNIARFTTIFNSGSISKGSKGKKLKGKSQNDARTMAKLVSVGIAANSIRDQSNALFIDSYAYESKEATRLSNLLAKELQNPKSETIKLYNSKQKAKQRESAIYSSYEALKSNSTQIEELYQKALRNELTQSEASLLETLSASYKFHAGVLGGSARQFINSRGE